MQGDGAGPETNTAIIRRRTELMSHSAVVDRRYHALGVTRTEISYIYIYSLMHNKSHPSPQLLYFQHIT